MVASKAHGGSRPPVWVLSYWRRTLGSLASGGRLVHRCQQSEQASGTPPAFCAFPRGLPRAQRRRLGDCQQARSTGRWRARRERNPMRHATGCPSCGHLVLTSAERCARCGHDRRGPAIGEPDIARSGATLLAYGLASLIVLLLIAAVAWALPTINEAIAAMIDKLRDYFADAR